MGDASRTLLDAMRKFMGPIPAAIGATIHDLARRGIGIKGIVRRTGHSRGLVRRILLGQRSDIFRVRENSLELYLPWLDEQ